MVLLLAWRTPRFEDPGSGRPVPPRLAAVLEGRGLSVVLRVAGLLLLGFAAYAAVAGQDLPSNPAFGIVYVWLWVGLVPASLVFGSFFRAVSPARAIHVVVSRAAGGPAEEASLPSRLGYWPAALALLAFVWLELVHPEANSLGALRLWFAIYLGVMVVGATWLGSIWLARSDPFEVYSTLVGGLSVWGRRPDGTLVLRAPIDNLARTRPEPGLVAVVAVLLGSTAFDSIRSSNAWVRFTQSTDLDVPLLNTAMLVGFCVLVGLTFAGATMAMPVEGATRAQVPGLFAHSVVPIVVGYMVAHYLTFFVEVGFETLVRASDPLGDGSNLFGTANWEVGYWLSTHPTFLATVKVLAIVAGHVVGVIAAHDRAVRLLPARRRVVGQLPLLAVMVAYTVGGLYLLFSA